MTIKVGLGGSIIPPFDAVVRAARRSEEKGYDSVWWPDHLMGWHPPTMWTEDITPLAAFWKNPNIYLDPIATIAAVGTQTERLRLGTAVTEPVRRHPAMLANEWLTLDHITGGRAILGIGAGEGENIIPYGLRFDRPASRFEEALSVIRLLWENDDPVDFDGDFWTMRGAVCGMAPLVGGRFPPIWTGAHGPRMLEITGRLADGWIPVYMTPDEYAERLGIIHRAARGAGRDPGRFEAGMFAYTAVAADHDEAHRLLDTPIPKGFLLALSSEFYEARGLEHPLGKGAYGLRDYIPTWHSREDVLKAIDAVPFEAAHAGIMHGTPDDLVSEVKSLGERGLRHMVFMNISYLGDASALRESFHLLDAVLDGLKP